MINFVIMDELASFALTTNLDNLTDREKMMIPVLIEVSEIMDDLFWEESYGSKKELLKSLGEEDKKKVIRNYGPWDRLHDDRPIIPGMGPKPAGANFYPADMTAEEFDRLSDPRKSGYFTLIRRNQSGELVTVPYHEAFHDRISRAAALLLDASRLADDPGLKKYFALRADAFLTDDYFRSDMAWMDMKSNRVDFIAGPIETYEDRLFGYKAAHEAYILIKDTEWSHRLSRFGLLLPELQKALPVELAYKSEMPGSSSDLGVYDVIYYAGDCNAGSKTIAINLPNDTRVQLVKGSRRIQLKNAMQAKFESIVVPITTEVIAPDQLHDISFEAFFNNTLFHEVAHGLGCMNTIHGKGTVQSALRDQYTIWEEGKADILALYLESQLQAMGELPIDLNREYTTFLAGIFRSVRFGTHSAHGMANLIRFNYFREKEAFWVDSQGKYRVNKDQMPDAVRSLTKLILTLQGDGDYDRAIALQQKYGAVDESLAVALKRIELKNIPIDIEFTQGRSVLGL